MPNLVKALEKATNTTYTENGAKTNKSTLDAVLDLFSLGGAIRTKSDDMIRTLVSDAFHENQELTLRVVFYLGDIRNGQGERHFFKVAMKTIYDIEPKAIVKLLKWIPEFTRWDYLYEFTGTSLENVAYSLMLEEFNRCVKNGTTSLLFKWLKSTNTSSKESCALGRLTAKKFGLTEREYRKILSEKRALLGDAVVETKLSAKKFDEIDYEKIPSKASLKYRNAFYAHDAEGYKAFIEAVKSGEKTINASVTYPHEIISKYRRLANVDNTLEVAWKALPNYINTEENILTVVDVSGSMGCGIDSSNTQAIDVSIGLGIYTAEKLRGAFKDYMVTFSSHPELVKLTGNLRNKLQKAHGSNWDMSTNIQAVFELILKTAVKEKVDEADMPTKVLIISDMEFDSCAKNKSNFKAIKEKYKNAGYKMPALVFWNTNARNTQHPVRFDTQGTCLVSGFSPVILRDVLSGEVTTPLDMMMKVIMNPRYDVLFEGN